MTTSDPKPGLLLVGHGTRSAVGTRQFMYLARQLAAAVAPVPVEPAFLELQQPGIAAGVERLMARGVNGFLTVPLLLFEAGHAKRDIPAAVQVAIEAAPKGSDPMQHLQAEPLGLHPALIELSQQRYEEAVMNRSAVPKESTCLLLVGRGSHDESATADMHELARRRQAQTEVGRALVAFIAMARPSLDESLPAIAAARYRRVIVQPHLLFEGELADSVRRQVAAIAAKHPEQEWLVTPLLADRIEADYSGGASSNDDQATTFPRNINQQEPPLGGNKLLCGALATRYAEAIHVVATAGGV